MSVESFGPQDPSAHVVLVSSTECKTLNIVGSNNSFAATITNWSVNVSHCRTIGVYRLLADAAELDVLRVQNIALRKAYGKECTE